MGFIPPLLIAARCFPSSSSIPLSLSCARVLTCWALMFPEFFRELLGWRPRRGLGLHPPTLRARASPHPSKVPFRPDCQDSGGEDCPRCLWNFWQNRVAFLFLFFSKWSVAGFSGNTASDKQSRILFARIFVHPLSAFSAKHLFVWWWLEIVSEADEGGVLSSHSSAEKLNPALSYDIQCKCVFVCVLGWILNEMHNESSVTLSNERVLKLPTASLCQPTFKRCIVQSAFETHILTIRLDQCEARTVWGSCPLCPPLPRRGEDRTEVGQSLVERPVWRGRRGGNYLITSSNNPLSHQDKGCCQVLSCSRLFSGNILDKVSSDFQKNCGNLPLPLKWKVKVAVERVWLARKWVERCPLWHHRGVISSPEPPEGWKKKPLF